ncbi:RING-H2 finger protein ATL16-like [Dendrobium catenatum]|uniref:RING-type E3 ubiquitin transferase n=1 Tax=Dendrobium catenatum TaxID=906689 RepID=A0A2I0WZ49_9ASPA|nr:RING-H2 finger protein ATL16-like [Dendrobium catenatum]PKU80942.1 RING-H2 finger protein ATL80 [Dendrobium catenatum]
MASPPPPSPPPPPYHNNKSTKLDYYYFVVGLSLVAIVLLVTNAIAVGCCSWLRQFIVSRGAFSREFNEDDLRRWMPTYSYMKRKDDEEEGAPEAECPVCISAFEEGEQVRQMAQCGHSFHTNCIDMWLNSHNSCPVCRESVLPTPLQSMEMSASSFTSQDYLVSVSTVSRAAIPIALA